MPWDNAMVTDLLPYKKNAISGFSMHTPLHILFQSAVF